MAKTIHRTILTDDYMKAVISRHNQFAASLDSDKDITVISVYNPLKENLLKELALIREVSKDLQSKKDDEINRQAAAKAAEAEEKEKTKKETEVKETEQVKEVKENESS